MPSVTTITSYKPVGLVNRTAKKAATNQRAKLQNLALTMPKFREMVNGQKLESLQPREVPIVTNTIGDYYGCGEGEDQHLCDNCRGSF